MASAQLETSTLGARIRALRIARGWSGRFAADRAGISDSTLSRIENDEVNPLSFTVAKIAAALGAAMSDLAPRNLPSDPDSIAGWLVAPEIRTALVQTDLTEPATIADPRPVIALLADLETARELKLTGDYAGWGRIMPTLLRELHATASRGRGPDETPQALAALVDALTQVESVMRWFGFFAESWLAADRAHQAAKLHGSPLLLAWSDWSRAHASSSCLAFDRSLSLVTAAIPTAERAVDEPGGYELLGSLHLMAGYVQAGLGRRGDADDRVREAAHIATRTGDTTALSLSFGPTNIRFWRVAIAVEEGHPGAALEIARGTSPDLVQAPGRRADFYVDCARAHAAVGEVDAAIRALTRAERTLPTKVRAMSGPRDLVRVMIGDVHGEDRLRQLHDLGSRFGLAQV